MGLIGQHHAPAALPRVIDTCYPLYRRPGWVSGPVWTGAENLALAGIRSPDRPARCESLYRLSYPGAPVNVFWSNFMLEEVSWLTYGPFRTSELPQKSNAERCATVCCGSYEVDKYFVLMWIAVKWDCICCAMWGYLSPSLLFMYTHHLMGNYIFKTLDIVASLILISDIPLCYWQQ
jgi:hypothetical protein